MYLPLHRTPPIARMANLTIEEATIVLNELQRVRYIHASSLVLLVVDWACVFPDEVEYIWRSKWNLIKILYLLSRLGPYVDTPLSVIMYLGPDIPFQACEKMYRAAGVSTFFGIFVSEAILILRTTAIYGNTRTILYPLLGLYGSIAVAGSVILYIFLNSIVYGPPPMPGLPGCYLADDSTIVFFDFLLLLLFELVIVTLTLWKCFRSFRTSASVMRTLYRDSVAFFLVLFGLSLGNLLVFATAPPEYLDVLTTITRVFHSLISCRILLNIRRAAARPEVIEDVDEASQEVSRSQAADTCRSTRARTTVSRRENGCMETTGGIPLQTFRSSRPSRSGVPSLVF